MNRRAKPVGPQRKGPATRLTPWPGGRVELGSVSEAVVRELFPEALLLDGNRLRAGAGVVRTAWDGTRYECRVVVPPRRPPGHVLLTEAGVGCTRHRSQPCACVAAALLQLIDERPHLTLPARLAPAPRKLGRKLHSSSRAARQGRTLAERLRLRAVALHTDASCGGQLELIADDGPIRLELTMDDEDLFGEPLTLPLEQLGTLQGAEGLRLGPALQAACQADPLRPALTAELDPDSGELHLERRYLLGDQPLPRDRVEREAITIDRAPAWWPRDGKLHRIEGPPSALARLWRSRSPLPAPQTYELVRSQLPALRSCEAFEAGPALSRSRVIRRLEVIRVQASLAPARAGQPPRFALAPIYGDARLRLPLGELRRLRGEGRTRVRLRDEAGDVCWVELPTAGELDKVERAFAGDDASAETDGPPSASARGLLQLAADWDDGVELIADEAVRERIDRLTGQRHLEAPTPPGMASELRGYQREGLGWLQLMFELEVGCVLADEMGLGKTHQSMALLAHIHASPAAEPSLVVCPRSVLDHWEDKLARYLPGVAAHRYYGPERSPAPDGTPIWLTTYETVVRDRAALGGRRWGALVLDEAQRAKNVGTRIARALRKLDARFRLALSGTPIENRLDELWALVDLLNPGYLGGRSQFATRIAGPIEERGDEVAKRKLARLTRPLILRRRKADVLDDLPDKIEETLRCELAEQQRELYQAMLRFRAPALLSQLRDPKARVDTISVLALLTRLKQLCDHPSLMLTQVHAARARRAGERVGDGDDSPSLASQLEARALEEPLTLESGKFTRFAELLERLLEEGHKVVVFSQYLGMLDLIDGHCASQGIETSGLRGATVDRAAAIRRFEEPGCQVFLASLGAAGVGIDLTAASAVIHYDRWWNAAREDQATDRVHRIGQTRGVLVYRLVTADTVEERIDSLIRSKAGLADELLDDDAGLGRFDRDELISMLTIGASPGANDA